MKLFEFTYIFKKEVDLNDLLAEFNQDAVSVGFQNLISTSNMLVYTKEKTKKIVVSPQRYVYVVEAMFDKNELSDFVEDITQTVKSFENYIDGGKYTIRYVNVVNQGCGSLKKMKQLNGFSENREEIVSTGFRYFFVFDDSLCEFKVEPFLKDTQCLFFEGIYNVKESFDNEKTESTVKRAMEHFDKYVNEFIDLK